MNIQEIMESDGFLIYYAKRTGDTIETGLEIVKFGSDRVWSCMDDFRQKAMEKIENKEQREYQVGDDLIEK